MKVDIIPVLEDNYTYILHGKNGEIAVIDPGEAGSVIDYLEQNNLKPDFIFLTHHHWDHVNGVPQLKERYDCTVLGPKKERYKIKGLDEGFQEGDSLDFGGETGRIIETPGHTLGAVCLYFPDSGVLFTGDTLFSMGTGRLFEGTAAQMWQSLERLAQLPDDTKIYCGHEYTLQNARFCLKVEPDNKALKERLADVEALRAQDLPTLPTTIKQEKQTNSFMRAGSADEYARIRTLKDRD